VCNLQIKCHAIFIDDKVRGCVTDIKFRALTLYKHSFSYAARTSPTYDPYRKSLSKSRSRSRSHSPVNSGQITYITSFGGEEESTDEGGRLPSSKFLTSSSSHSANVVVAPQTKASRSVYKLQQAISGQTSFVLVPYVFSMEREDGEFICSVRRPLQPLLNYGLSLLKGLVVINLTTKNINARNITNEKMIGELYWHIMVTLFSLCPFVLLSMIKVRLLEI